MSKLINHDEHPCFGVATATYKDYKLSFETYEGLESKERQSLLNENSIIRVASISKLITVIGVMELVRENLLDLDEDISVYLKSEIRNPSYPNSKITSRMLLAHTSSIRDGKSYSFSYDTKIIDVLKEDEHWASEVSQVDQMDGKSVKENSLYSRQPGQYFYYSNLNYGVMATIMEIVTGMRFDLLMDDKVFKHIESPMSFNKDLFNDDQRMSIADLCRLNNNGEWTVEYGYKVKSKDYEHYSVGTNGTLFGPQGSCHTTLNGLKELVEIIFDMKEDELFKAFLKPVWSFNEDVGNGNTYFGLMKSYGSGIHLLTGQGTDILTPNIGEGYIGHSAEAYGLLGGLYINLDDGNGVIYLITGTGIDLDEHLGERSAFYRYEELLLDDLSTYFI